jgi:hypothetical protein
MIVTVIVFAAGAGWLGGVATAGWPFWMVPVTSAVCGGAAGVLAAICG